MLIQSDIRGYFGNPSSVIAAHDPDAGIVIIVRSLNLLDKRLTDTARICNIVGQDDVDMVFSEDDLEAGISAFYDLYNAKLLDISKLEAVNPQGSIQLDGIKDSGRIYRIDPAISNAKVAVLAIALWVQKQRTITETLSFCDDLSSLMAGRFMRV
jgi:hypothetical protein